MESLSKVGHTIDVATLQSCVASNSTETSVDKSPEQMVVSVPRDNPPSTGNLAGLTTLRQLQGGIVSAEEWKNRGGRGGLEQQGKQVV